MAAEPVVHIVDDDEAVRDSLGFLLEAAGYATRAWSSGESLLAALPTLEPGCIVLDVRMPGMDGVSVLRQLRERGAPHPVVMMTGHGDVPVAVRAMKAGAVDFIEKPFAQEVMLDCIRASLAQAGRGSAGAEALARLRSLSPREREVLEGLIAGNPNKTIAFDLGISPRTVEIHRARVMDKMGARSLSELVRLGLAAGIDPEGNTGQS